VRPYELLKIPAPAVEVGVPINLLLFNVVENQIQIQSVLVE
jgi:hypothetical protein